MDTEPFLEWGDYIRNSFFSAWERNTLVDLTDYAFLIEHHFNLQKMNAQILREISQTEDGIKAERYHKTRIRTLAQLFVESLLDVTDDGKHITSKNIEKAKMLIQDEQRCIYNC